MTIRTRVLEHLRTAPRGAYPDQPATLDLGEVFHYVGGQSWPTFCREIYRMRAASEIELDQANDEEAYISLAEHLT